MKIIVTLLMLLVLLLPTTPAQEYTRWNLPEGAVARLGKGGVREILYSPDGTVRSWDVKTGEQKGVFTGHAWSVYSVAFSPDGGTLASGSGSYVYLRDAKTWEQKQIFTGRGRVYSVAFSPDGGTLACGDGDNTVRLWDVKTGEPKGVFTGHTREVASVSFSPDGKTLASGSVDRTVLLWKVDYGEF